MGTAKIIMRDLIFGTLIAVLAVAAFWPVIACDFVGYDDPDYVTENTRVREGLTPANAAWAFTHTHSHWIPLDTLSHMLDCTLFGLNPAGHHAVNLALHATCAVLLFVLLRMATGAAWPAAIAAALFAIHPFNVEPVAWISSRKDVLSTALALGSSVAYVWYARKTGWGRYGVVMALFMLALLAKPMVLTLPVLFLVLDIWPLRRLTFPVDARAHLRPLLLEKAPLAGLAVISAAVTYYAQTLSDSVMSGDVYPFGMRLSNALASHLVYLRKFVWPSGFSVFYPHPGDTLPFLLPIAAFIILAMLTALALWQGIRRAPSAWFFTGWAWFLIALFPVSGIPFQLAGSAMADRYMYLPMIGLCIIAAWGAYAIAGQSRLHAAAVACAVIAALSALALVANRQIGHWRDSEKLWHHALAVTGPENIKAHNGLGTLYLKQNRLDEAAPHLAEAVRLAPNLHLARNNYGLLLAMRGDLAGAEREFRGAIAVKPDYAMAQANLAKCLLSKDDPAAAEEARVLLQKALALFDDTDPAKTHVVQMLNHIQQLK